MTDTPRYRQISFTAGGGIFVTESAQQRLYQYLEHPPYRVERFSVRPATPADEASRLSPSQLLAPAHQVIPFRGRESEITDLTFWRESGSDVAVRLLHGPGGRGKTRLAYQFAAQASAAGWTVAVASRLSTSDSTELAVSGHGLLILVDLADRWPLPELLKLVRDHHRASKTTLRVLLISRPAAQWWQTLSVQLQRISSDLAVSEMECRPLATTEAQRQDLFHEAWEAFASVLGGPSHAPNSLLTHLSEVDDYDGELVLTIHMAALVGVDSATRNTRPPSAWDKTRLAGYLLDRERAHWHALHVRSQGRVPTDQHTMRRLVYLATLTRALSFSDAGVALERVGVTTGRTAITIDPLTLLRDHAHCYPPADDRTMLAPLLPDRLGEDFIGLTTPGHRDVVFAGVDPWAGDAPSLLLSPRPTDGGPPAWTAHALSTLVEAAARWPHLAELHLFPLLIRYPELALHAGGATLARVVEIPGIPLRALAAMEPLLPGAFSLADTSSPTGPAPSVHELEAAAALLSGKLADHRALRTADSAERAALLLAKSRRLAVAGRAEEAVEAARAAVDAYRETGLTRAHALATHQLAMRLAEAGADTEALKYAAEGVRLYAELSYDEREACLPEVTRAVADIAALLLKAPGRREEALSKADEAVRGFRRLVDRWDEGYLPDLAAALSLVSRIVAAQGWSEDALVSAREAVSIRERLAQADPRHEPELAAELQVLSSRMAQCHMSDQAREAQERSTEIYGRLAERDPDTHAAAYALALTHTAQRTAATGGSEAALEALQTAVSIHRRLIVIDWARYAPELASALSQLGSREAAAGDKAKATVAMQESVDIYQRLCIRDRPTFEAEMTVVLQQMAALTEGTQPSAGGLRAMLGRL